MRTTTRFGAALLALALGPALAAQDDDPALGARSVTDPDKAETYVGFYKIVSGENDGEPIPEERIESHVVRITQEMIIVLDADENTLYSCTYELDEAADPDRLAMESTGGPADAVGQTAWGIITRGTNDEGEPFVMLCYRTVGDEYPEEFRTQAQSEMNLFVLEPIPDPSEGVVDPRD
jgi:uncharacterized protein (TIGR03067 family)